jgi:hypothetical protein
MKAKDIPVFRQKVLDALPITQADISKMLGIDHRDASKLIGIMLKEHVINRTKVDRTFLINKNGEGLKTEKKKDFGALLSNGKFSPCSGCESNCDPENCEKLATWIL